MKAIVVSLSLGLLLVACGDSSTPSTGNNYDTPQKLLAYMNGKTLTMTGANIPTHPNGYDRNTNFGAASQCINKTTIVVASDTFNVTTLLGTLNNAPNVGDTGTCDIDTVAGSPLTFTSTSVLIENVQGNGQCFDITVNYGSFSQEGRASISANGQTIVMELYFSGQAAGHRCADGNVGASGVTVQGAAFTGDAQQTYTVTTTP